MTGSDANHRGAGWCAALVVSLAGVAVIAAACSTGTPAVSSLPSTTTVGGGNRGGPPSSASPGNVPSTNANPTTTTSSPGTCATRSLRATPGSSGAAAGTIVSTIVLTNESSSPCALEGYPGLKMISAAGSALPTNVVDGGGPALVNKPVTRVVLGAHGGQASFLLSWSDVPVGTETSCPQSTVLEVIPPGDVSATGFPDRIQPCGGGTIHVSPVQEGVVSPQ